jgi:BspA type Leucine rich repeat region (6 copies)
VLTDAAKAPVVGIPDATNGLPVVSIGNGAFYFNSSVTQVSLPDTVTNIGANAFYWCTIFLRYIQFTRAR